MPKVGDEIFYEKMKGEGRPLVFIHGWLGSHKSWKMVDKNLDLDNPRIFYDLRCHGNSRCTTFSFETLAEDLEKLLDTLDIDNPVLIGHSMGGMVALTYTTIYDNFSGLFLVGTSASTPEPENKSPRFFLEKFGSINRTTWAELIVENYAPETEHPELKSMVLRELVHANDTEIIYSLGSMLEYDVREEVSEIEEPKTVVAGENDGAITMDKSRELANLLDCPLKKIDSSHLMLQEKPGEVAELLEEFLSQ